VTGKNAGSAKKAPSGAMTNGESKKWKNGPKLDESSEKKTNGEFEDPIMDALQRRKDINNILSIEELA